MKPPPTIIKPQPGYQEIALSSSADIVIGGAAAFVGKTFALLLDPLRYVHNKDFRAVIFRRTTKQVRNANGLWDTSMGLYSGIGGKAKETTLDWDWSSGARISFAHLEYEKNIYDWMGSQITFLAFDELTHFTETMFFYLLSRNRSTCDIRPCVRATCNPDPESWVAKLIEWWIDAETGFPILERRGVIRYFIKYGPDYIWGSSYEEVAEKASGIIGPMMKESGLQAKDFIKSITFVSGSIYDNKIGIKNDPSYPGNLLSQSEDERRRLLEGCWKMSVSPKDIYDYESFKGCFDNVKEVDKKGKYITADIALEGSNKLVVIYWEGNEAMDIEIMDKSDGPMVVELISSVAKYYGVENKNISYDADGVGGFVKGYLRGSVPFHGGAPAIEVKDATSEKRFKENYFNFKTQCFYHSGRQVNEGNIKINSRAANKMYDNTMTIRQRFMYERRAIKKDKTDMDGKLCILPKKEMKVLLNGDSPDLMDALSQKSVFDLKPAKVFIG